MMQAWLLRRPIPSQPGSTSRRARAIERRTCIGPIAAGVAYFDANPCERPMAPQGCVAPAPQVLREVFGLPSFRGRQYEAVQAALAGKDVLTILPTGAGELGRWGPLWRWVRWAQVAH